MPGLANSGVKPTRNTASAMNTVVATGEADTVCASASSAAHDSPVKSRVSALRSNEPPGSAIASAPAQMASCR